MQRSHGVEHYTPDSCFGCKVLTVGFAPSIFTTTPGGAKAADNNKRERELVGDLAAFKRMRQQGLQPRATRGAARVESEAESTFEVASGQFAHQKAKGKDAGKSISRRGKEWRERAEAAHTAVQRGEVVSS
jgi:hypothetical protein